MTRSDSDNGTGVAVRPDAPAVTDDAAAAPTRRGRWPSWRTLSRIALIGLLADVVAVVACGVDAARLGKGMDVSFDLLNYHYYYSYLLFHGGVGQADPEPFQNRFLNPLPEVPWYLFDQALRPRASSAAIGLVAGLNLPLIRRITLRLLPAGLPEAKKLALSIAAVAVAAVGADFRMEIGTSLADVVVSVPMLAALLLVLRAAQDPESSWWPFAFAGLLSGVAFGAKLTMACYVAALGLAVIVLAALQRRVRPVVGHAAGVLVGGAVAGGWWFWSVWRATGNPVFPFYNSIFHSADWSGPDLTDPRYGPHGLVDALKYPLYMWQGTRRLVDVPVRDPRWLVLAALAALALVVALARTAAKRELNHLPARLIGRPPVLAFAVFGIVGSAVWLFQFGISRYAVSSELLVGPAAALLLLALLRRPVLATIAAVIMAASMFPFVQGYFRHAPFQANRYEVQTGPLRQIPAGSVVISDAGAAPSSFLLAYLPKGVKGHVVHPWFYGQPLLAKLERQQLATAPHVYVIEPAAFRQRQAALRAELHLQLLPTTCVPIRIVTGLRYRCAADYVGAEGAR